MIEHVNRICGRLNKAGVLLRSRGFLLLGGAGMVSGTVLRKESRKRSGKE